MLPSPLALEEARKARDPRFDGRFFVGVRTTGIYCRPVCPVKLPREENVVFFAAAAQAIEAGYRPCLRCRPEASPGTPAWMGTSTTVSRALKLINEGALDDGGTIAGLSDRLGVTTRHLSRLFARHLGVSPKTVAQTRRLQFAKKLIDETMLPMTEIAMSAGYGSVRRFNDHFRQVYARAPRQLRKEGGSGTGETLVLQLPYREPFSFNTLLDFYRVRATPGVEQVTGSTYSRNFLLDNVAGRLMVSAGKGVLTCRVEGGSSRALMRLHGALKRMFDLDAVPAEVNRVLCSDRKLAALVRQAPGLRLPGAFDPFEIAVRAIVGQQVSVKGASTVMGRIAEQYGKSTDYGPVFPDADRLARLDPASLPMPRKRAEAIRSLAAEVASGRIAFDQTDKSDFEASLLALPGIGPWTAQYIAMRALGDPDAFLQGDLVIRKVVKQLFGLDRERDLLALAERWRPWRGYAGMHLWRYAAEKP